MGNSGKTIGLILMLAGAALFVAVLLWVGAGVADGRYEGLAAPVLGVGAALIFGALPLLGLGAFLFFKGRQEAVGMAEVQRERTLLNMVQTRGQIDIPTAVLELKVSRDVMRGYVYDLVGKGLFTGYVNWDKGMLYSRQRGEMPTDKCPNCGGQLEMGGKGVIKCPFCGTEIFLPGG